MSKFDNLRVGVVYRPPDATLEESISLFNFIKNNVTNVIHFAVYGDFNLPDINWDMLIANSKISCEFLTLCFRTGFSQCVSFPTRNDNLLDLIFMF